MPGGVAGARLTAAPYADQDSGWTKETYNLSVLSILDSLIEEAYNDFC